MEGQVDRNAVSIKGLMTLMATTQEESNKIKGSDKAFKESREL